MTTGVKISDLPGGSFVGDIVGAFVQAGTTKRAGILTPSLVLQTITATGTYTPTAGMVNVLVIGVGGGGGGGGVQVDATDTVGLAGGAGSGACCIGLYTAAQIGVSQSVTIGAAGAAGADNGGSNAANDGGDGGDTLFGTAGALFTAGGGKGSSGLFVTTLTPSAPGAGGVATGATLNFSGNAGTTADAFWGYAGQGAPSIFGGSPLAVEATPVQAGLAGLAFGAAGGGAAVFSDANPSAAALGGAGFVGVLLALELVFA